MQGRKVPSSSKTFSTGGHLIGVQQNVCSSLFRETPYRPELALFLKCLDLNVS